MVLKKPLFQMAMFSQFSAGNKDSASGRGFFGLRLEDDYVVISSRLPLGITTFDSVFLQCDVKEWPYPVEAYREEMRRLGLLLYVEDPGSYKMSNVYIFMLKNIAAKRTSLEAKDLCVRGDSTSYLP